MLKKDAEGKLDYVNKSIYKRDIFYDAVIVTAYRDRIGWSM